MRDRGEEKERWVCAFRKNLIMERKCELWCAWRLWWKAFIGGFDSRRELRGLVACAVKNCALLHTVFARFAGLGLCPMRGKTRHRGAICARALEASLQMCFAGSSNPSGHAKSKKPRSEERGFLARPGGFEPSTYRFVAGHSIHWAKGANIGASDGNRTHATSLEGWNSTIELHSHKDVY